MYAWPLQIMKTSTDHSYHQTVKLYCIFVVRILADRIMYMLTSTARSRVLNPRGDPCAVVTDGVTEALDIFGLDVQHEY